MITPDITCMHVSMLCIHIFFRWVEKSWKSKIKCEKVFNLFISLKENPINVVNKNIACATAYLSTYHRYFYVCFGALYTVQLPFYFWCLCVCEFFKWILSSHHHQWTCGMMMTTWRWAYHVYSWLMYI